MLSACLRLSSCVALLLAVCATAMAQPRAVGEATIEAERSEAVAPAGAETGQIPLGPAGDNLPVAPETEVVGRPGAFPSEPLPTNVAVTPSLTETQVGEIGSSLTVITQAEIFQSQKATVSDVLRDVPGLDVAQQGPTGGLTSVFIRGANSQGTKVLIDGMPVNDPSNAGRSFDFSLLTVDNIDRIEVLRGPQSTLYGSDAMGGVVNIITKRGEGPATLRTELQGGSYGTARETLNVSGGNKRTYYSIGAAYLQSDGFSAADERFGNVENDGVRNATFSGRFGATPTEDFDVDYVFRYVDMDSKIDDYDFTLGRPVDNFFRQNRVEAFFNRISTRLMTFDGLWEHRLGFSYIDYDRLDTAPGPYDVPRFTGFTRKVDYRSNFYLADWYTLTVGTDYQAEESPTNTQPYTSQTDASVYFENQFRLAERWFTTVGARWDDYSLAGPASTYRVTTLYRLPSTQTAFHGSIGTAFRAPALAEYAYQDPNAPLRPEQNKGWDCGITQPFADGRFTIDGTYFRNDFTDLIQFNYNTWYLDNVGRALTDGVELTLTWKINCATSLVANYTYTFTEDLATGSELLRRAPHKARVAVNRRFLGGRGNLLVDCNYYSPRLDSTLGNPITLEEYWLASAATTIDLTEHWQLVGRLANILGEYYEEVYGYGAPRTSFYGGLVGHW